MKATPFFILAIIISTLCPPHSVAQDYTQWALPEGAKVRLGKGIIRDVQFFPDSTRLAVASSIGIWIYDAQTYQEIDLLTGHTSSVWSLVFSPDGRTLASGSWDKTLRLWDTTTEQHKKTLVGHSGQVYCIAFSPDSTTIASGGIDGTVLLWDLSR